MLPSSLLCSEIGALVALYLLLKYLSKTQNSFANIKEERVKKKNYKNGLLGLWHKKRKVKQKNWREASHWGGKAEVYYRLEICKTVTNSVVVFSEVSKDHILPFIHPHNTHWWESALCCSWVFISHLFCVTCLFLLILVKWVVHPHVSSHGSQMCY